MKILFSPCHYKYEENFEGSEPSLAFNIADRIASKNDGSVVVTGFKQLNDKKQYEIVELQKNKKTWDMSLVNAIIFNFKYYKETNKLIKNNRFDIIHHVLPFGLDSTFNLSLLLNKINGVPFIVGPVQAPQTFIDSDSDASNRIRPVGLWKRLCVPLEVPIFLLPRVAAKYLSRMTLKKASCIIAMNNHAKKIILNLGIDGNRIKVIHPGIDTNKFLYNSYKKIESTSIELITVSYLLKRKGIELIIKALDIVAKNHRNIKLRIIGDGPQKANLKKLVHDLNLDGIVFFEGFVPNHNICEFYNKSDIYVSMSRSESFGHVYIEAMACGLPVITAENNGSREIVINNINGFLIPQEDYEALAEKIRYFINNPKLLESFGKNARMEMENNYDWDRCIIPKYLEIYKKLIEINE